ncbi:MAG: alpha-hydroxy-acid oxidizing protein [Candidatus Dormibacteraeota bacterium]|nr:alpha-hydroxy-acid oxidizing protein [Candidatus Dormibacteraeota bacterium]MBV9524231.1 alpha-hydroxy-acid oxidizing protein [Candidatus Dormibacteraeota bacterium]
MLAELLARHEETARARLDGHSYDYIAGGGAEEISVREAAAAWRRIRLRPRVLRDVTEVDTSCEVAGIRVSAPVLVAPTAFHAIAHPDGEVETARGVAAAGGLMIVATRSNADLDAVVAALGSPWLFQVYVMRDRDITASLVERAARLGARALVLTGDAPVLSRRRHGHILPPLTEDQYLGNLRPLLKPGTRISWDTAQDPSITFETIGWLRELSGLPVYVKGVLRGDDAAACLDAGAAGVVVSNHGGRQLDRAVAAAVALPGVVAAVGGRGEVLVDGGIRSGIDILIALAMGARAVLVGRPVSWALASDGAAGVQQLLDALRDDLREAMALAGARAIADVDRSLVASG